MNRRMKSTSVGTARDEADPSLAPLVVLALRAPAGGSSMIAGLTLLRGTDHIEQHIAPLWSDLVLAGGGRTFRLRARVTANALRELDRFLNLLIDAATTAAGGRARPGERHTANKLRGIGAGEADYASLLAVGRVRDCLFHCNGVVRHGDRRGATSLTLAWRTWGRTTALGDRLNLGTADILAICALYRRIGSDLICRDGLRDLEKVLSRQVAEVGPSRSPPAQALRRSPARDRAVARRARRDAC